MKKLLGILGPTAVGKTEVSLLLAKSLNTDIISADSMQIYKYLDIGTAKILPEQQKGVTHHMIDVCLPNQSFSSFDYAREVNSILETYPQNKTPLVVGGTGYYFDTLLYPINYEDLDTSVVRNKLCKELEQYGKEYLYEKLQKIDPVSASQIHPNNTVRVMRALEIFESVGKQKSQCVRTKEAVFENCLIVLNCDRNILYDRINKRVDIMIDSGLVDEVEALLKNYSIDNQCFKAIGYKEVISYLKNEIDYDTMICQIKQNSRNYAKRQITFFKRFKNAVWIDTCALSQCQLVEKILEEYNK